MSTQPCQFQPENLSDFHAEIPPYQCAFGSVIMADNTIFYVCGTYLSLGSHRPCNGVWNFKGTAQLLREFTPLFSWESSALQLKWMRRKRSRPERNRGRKKKKKEKKKKKKQKEREKKKRASDGTWPSAPLPHQAACFYFQCTCL